MRRGMRDIEAAITAWNTLKTAFANMCVLEPVYIRRYGWPLAMAFAIYIGHWVKPPQADYVGGSVPWYWYALLFLLIQAFGIFLGFMFGMIPIAGVWYWEVYFVLFFMAVIHFLFKLSVFGVRLRNAILWRIDRFIEEEYDRARNPENWC